MHHKNISLTPEELTIENDIELSNYIPVENMENEIKKVQLAAKAFNKRRKITITVLERYIQQLKTEAAQAGIPYQTYINSILHKFLTGQLIDTTSFKKEYNKLVKST